MKRWCSGGWRCIGSAVHLIVYDERLVLIMYETTGVEQLLRIEGLTVVAVVEGVADTRIGIELHHHGACHRSTDELSVRDTSPADGILLLQGAHIVKDNGEVDTAFDTSSLEALSLNGSAGKPFA